MASHKKNPSNQKPLLGRKYKFIGQKPRACTQCGFEQKRGMLVEYQDHSFCSERCVVSYVKR